MNNEWVYVLVDGRTSPGCETEPWTADWGGRNPPKWNKWEENFQNFQKIISFKAVSYFFV